MADQAARQLQYEYKAVRNHTFWIVYRLKLKNLFCKAF